MSKKVDMYRKNSRKLDTMPIRHSNQEILQGFLGIICRLVSKGTSDTYAAMVIGNFNKKNSVEFSFVRYIHIHSNKVEIDKEINSIDSKLVGKFINNLINSLFSDLFKHLIKMEFSSRLLNDLKSLDVRF